MPRTGYDDEECDTIAWASMVERAFDTESEAIQLSASTLVITMRTSSAWPLAPVLA